MDNCTHNFISTTKGAVCEYCQIQLQDIFSRKEANRDEPIIEETFTKFDNGKPMLSLVEPQFIIGMAEVMTYGAKKYAIENWKKATKDDIRRIKDSLLRHTLAYTSGELIDKETGLSHAFHASCNLMFLNYMIEVKGLGNE